MYVVSQLHILPIKVLYGRVMGTRTMHIAMGIKDYQVHMPSIICRFIMMVMDSQDAKVPDIIQIDINNYVWFTEARQTRKNTEGRFDNISIEKKLRQNYDFDNM